MKKTTQQVKDMPTDIAIEGSREYPSPYGKFTIRGISPAGLRWLSANYIPVNGIDLDDLKIVEDTMDRAFWEGLAIDINGRRYLGFGMVAVPPRPNTYRNPKA